MKVRQFFEKTVAVGRANDPRGEEGVKSYLARERRLYESLAPDVQKDFDQERLVNPYHDTRLLNGPEDVELKAIIVGVDFEVPELLLADRLRANGRPISMCMAHHPEGYAIANMYRVMDLQADVMAKLGIPINVAEGIMDSRIHEVKRRMLSANHTRAVDAARLLGFPFVCCHTVADNCVNKFLQDIFDTQKPETVQEALEILGAQPEYANARRTGSGLMVLSRSVESQTNYSHIRAGEVFVDMTGGTGGSKWMFEKLAANTHVGTFIGMHISEDNLEIARQSHINVIVAGHSASDSLGINLLLDRVLAGTDVEVIPCSGYNRVPRS